MPGPKLFAEEDARHRRPVQTVKHAQTAAPGALVRLHLCSFFCFCLEHLFLEAGLLYLSAPTRRAVVDSTRTHVCARQVRHHGESSPRAALPGPQDGVAQRRRGKLALCGSCLVVQGRERESARLDANEDLPRFAGGIRIATTSRFPLAGRKIAIAVPSVKSASSSSRQAGGQRRESREGPTPPPVLRDPDRS